MKVTIYELLGMIKDGKAPKKFIYDNQLFILDEEDNVYRSHLGNRFGAMYQLDIKLNDEVEIIEKHEEEPQEHKIPEKINWKEKESMAGYLTKDKQIEVIARRTEHLKKSINEILDYLEANND